MITTVLLLVGSAVLIYFSCEFFVNGVEWVGRKAGVGQTAVGTVLAAFGTALPESVVTLVAVAFRGGRAESKDIGVGAALGGPLVLSTVAYAVVGLVLWSVHRSGTRSMNINERGLARDQGWFLIIFVCKVALGFVAFAGKHWLGFAFLAAYGVYVWTEIRAEGDVVDEEELEPLMIRRQDESPSFAWAGLQTAAALGVIFFASRLFVHQLETLGPALGLAPSVVALLLSPIATELPETMNAIIWVRQGKQRLALANISGAMMIQATVPSAFGILFTPWMFDRSLLWAAVVTSVSILGLLVLLRRGALVPRRLAAFGLLYGVFAVGLFAFHL